MRKIILLAINAKYVHSALAVWLLAGGIKKYARTPYAVEIIEATIHQSDQEIAALVAAHNPDVVGVSTYIWNGSKLPGLLQHMRGLLPQAVFVLGGPEASYNMEYWLENGADYVIQGEGERKLPALLDALEMGNITQSIPEIDVSIDPYNEVYISTLRGKLAYIETSRGCPYKCAFCLSGGDDIRFFPLEMAKNQIYKLTKSGVNTIKFVDRTFNCNAARAYQLFEYVISLDTSCCFHFEVAADLFDQQTLSLLGAAQPGRIQVEAGLQSYYEPTLAAISRKMNIAKTEQNIKALLQNKNIHVHVDLIAGLPYETLEDFKESFNRAYSLRAHNLQLGFLKLLHGSALREQAGALGIKYRQAPPYEIISSPWLSQEDLQTLKQAENPLRHTYNKSRFLSTLEYVFAVSGMKPFDLYCMMGNSVQNHGLSLEIYAENLYDCFCNVKGVDFNDLQSHMICDWLTMVRGKNMPRFLRQPDSRRKQVVSVVEKKLGRKISREEVAFLPSGESVYVDVESRDPVTGLYKLVRLYS
ncbi:MAG: B12-binding domain-containing radical SAM protein [Defluviitaleaceae bacterium]|nr:B12-binding domain-containing radical SAM protein [Defluviitaleaceae bacterium]